VNKVVLRYLSALVRFLHKIWACIYNIQKKSPISIVSLTAHDTPTTDESNGMCCINIGFYADQ
jgi:hypothetical protein